MYELYCLRQSEEYGVCFDERAVEVHFFSIKKQSFFDGKTERAKAWRALFHNLKDSPWLGLLRRCRNAAFQSSVRDQFGYLRVLCASPFGGTIPCALLIGSSGCILLLVPSRSDRQLLKRQLTCLTGTYRLPLEYICFLQKSTGNFKKYGSVFIFVQPAIRTSCDFVHIHST